LHSADCWAIGGRQPDRATLTNGSGKKAKGLEKLTGLGEPGTLPNKVTCAMKVSLKEAPAKSTAEAQKKKKKKKRQLPQSAWGIAVLVGGSKGVRCQSTRTSQNGPDKSGGDVGSAANWIGEVFSSAWVWGVVSLQARASGKAPKSGPREVSRTERRHCQKGSISRGRA